MLFEKLENNYEKIDERENAQLRKRNNKAHKRKGLQSCRQKCIESRYIAMISGYT